MVIADDHESIRLALKAILAADPNISVVAEAADGREAIAAVVRLLPDVLILDNNMPLLSGVEVARRLQARLEPRPTIVFFSTEAVPADALRPRDRAVLKDARPDEILRAVVEAASARAAGGPAPRP